jgi:hypothetical protein
VLTNKILALKTTVTHPSPVTPKKVLSISDKLLTMAGELDKIELECKPEHRGYVFQIRRSLDLLATQVSSK